MSDSIFRIRSIANCEAKVIMRGWLFRIAFLLPIAFLAVFLLTSVFHSRFLLSAMIGFFFYPSFISWIITIFYAVYSSLILAAVATNSGWREWKLDTLDGARVRPFSNVEHMIGKLAGQLAAFFLMTVSVMVLVLGIDLFNPETTVFTAGYLLYPLIVWVPAFFFVAGLSMIVSRMVRGQMLSLLIVTAAIISCIALSDRYYHFFDMTSFRMPLFFSKITGLSFPELIARQRLLYTSAGLALVAATTALSRRPPGRRFAPVVSSLAAAALLAVGLYSGTGYAGYFSTGERLRERIRQICGPFRPLPRMEPAEYDILVDQEGCGIDCVVRMVLENRSGAPVDRYVFTLNPGLNVTEVHRDSDPMIFRRDLHLLEVLPPAPLEAGASDTIEVVYGGIVDGRVMFSDVPEGVRCSDISFGDKYISSTMPALNLFRVPRDVAPLRYDYILLVPDAMWYPVPALPYDPGSPGDDRTFFSRFKMRVKPRDGLTAFSQGERTIGEDGAFLFWPEYPLTDITLAIGELKTRTIEIDSIEYNLCSTPGSEEIVGLLESARDTVPGMIRYLKDKFEYSLGLSYPFRRFTILEVPASFWPFNRPLRDTGFGFAQPEILMVQERGISLELSYLPGMLGMNRKYKKEARSSLEEMNRSSILHALRTAIGRFIRENEANVFPMYFRHATSIMPGRYPHLGLLLERMAGESVLNILRSRHMTGDGLTDGERANRKILEGKFLEAAMAPAGYRWAGGMAGHWAGHHYYLIEHAAGTGSLTGFLRDLVKTNRFQNIEEDEFLEAFARRFGFRLESILIDLEDPAEIPGYIYGNFDCCEFVDGDRKRYRMSFDILNPEKAGGVLVITAALKYPKAVRKSLRRKVKSPVLAIEIIGPGEARRIEFEADYKPTTIWIDMMISRNIPSRMTWRPEIEISGSCAAGLRNSGGISMPVIEEGTIVVDDQDPGFATAGGKRGGLLRRLFPGADVEREIVDMRSYYTLRDPPPGWIMGMGEGFFGRYVRSARCIGAGDGRARAIWRTRIARAGEYDVYCYIHDPYRRFSEERRGEKGIDRIEHHYTVHHSKGTNEVMLIPDLCEDGWNLLGRYYFEVGEASVELSDESPAAFILADAVKWARIK